MPRNPTLAASEPHPALIVESPHAWDQVWQRPHHLVSRLARWAETLYVSPRYLRDAFRSWLRKSRASSGKSVEGVCVARPLQIHGEALSPILRWNQRQVLDACAAFVKSHQPSASQGLVVWIYDPHKYYLANAYPDAFVVYDVMDEYSAFPWAPPDIKEEERELLKRADLVIAGTWTLYDAKRSRTSRPCHAYPSAVEAERFMRPAHRPPAPAELVPLRMRYKALLGYVGTIDMRLDAECLSATMARHPEWGLALIGPVRGDFPSLRRLENCHFLGPKPYVELPPYLWNFNVALVPFVDSELTRHVNPTKVLEYFAAGLPVVARALPEMVRCYKETAVLYTNTRDFENKLIETVRRGDADPRIMLGAEKARAYSWEKVASEIWQKVTEGLEKRNAARR
ncbi:MAG: glycosyltransferase [bacterium]